MTRTRGKAAFAAWIACIAILLSSLAPAIAHALQRDGQGAWAEVCTTSGSKVVSLDSGLADEAPSLPAEHPLQHCPYCSLHAPALGMPPGSLAVPTLVPQLSAVPEPMLAAPRTLFAWATAQPRAPPRLS